MIAHWDGLSVEDSFEEGYGLAETPASEPTSGSLRLVSADICQVPCCP
jgi:hypothetical protein